jgi:hypothetical protein
MSRHQIRLLLCSTASVALIVGATLVLEWFRIDVSDTRMTIGMRAGIVCAGDGTCASVGLRGTGAYRVLAEGAFWSALLLALLVIAQAGMSVFSGAASTLASAIGYAIGSITLLCAFGAGYLFAPDPPAELAMMGIAVTRTIAPAMLVVGSLLGIVAVHYAQLEEVSNSAGEYKPVVVERRGDEPDESDAHDRARSASASDPRTRRSSQRIERVVSPAASESASRARRSSQQIERIALPGDRTKSPSEPGRSRSSSQQVERIALPGDRTKSPSEPGRSRTPSQQVERIPLPGHRTRSPSDPGDVARSRSPSQQPLVARTASPGAGERSRSPSSQPLVARTPSPGAGERSRSPSQQPLVSRTASPGTAERSRSPSQQPLVARTSSPAHGGPARRRLGSEPPGDGIDVPSRARTSSSGPIDIAARLSGAPLAVAIKPPLPEPVPVPPDQIPVAPESGLVIRKRTGSAAPLSAQQLSAAAGGPPSVVMPPPPGAAAAPPIVAAPPSAAARPAAAEAPPPIAHSADASEIPVAPESGLVIRKKPTSPDLQRPQAFGVAPPPRGASGITPPGAMPSIALPSIDPDIGNPLAPPAPSQLPAPESDPAIPRAFTPPDKPPALRGKLRYAVNMATLTSMGITAQREDGTTKHVGWDDIIGIIARRMPPEAPYDGVTFVDLVSISGSTLRILPWTRLDGAPVRGEGEERARAVVQLIAARCLEAKLDSWTKVFADGAGHAAQLPSTNTLAAHDDKLA